MDRTLIFDVGAHAGDDSDFYLAKGFRVVAVEAAPNLCERLQKRFAHYDARFTLVNAAITNNRGPVNFLANPGASIWGTLDPDFAARNAKLGFPSQEVEVPGVRLQDLLASYGVPYYLKIDIEGADLTCLCALADSTERPQYASIESEKKDWKGLLREFEIFSDLGYRKFKVVDQRFHKLTKPPVPAKEGASVDYTFKGHCSGLFGEEIPGGWLTAEEAIREYSRIFRHYRLFGDDGLIPGVVRNLFPEHRKWGAAWYDTHAAL
ncbi:MAG: FkbM family methyltransferase [Candidatus Korobacteraceae bacterium]